MSSSNCCFLTCIQISPEADQVVRYSQLFQNFSQFIVMHTVKGFGIVNKAEISLQLCPVICNPMDCSPPGSSVHGILQARMLEWVAILFSRGSSQLRAQTWVSSITGGFFTIWATREALASLNLTILDTSYHNSQDTETLHPSISDEQTKTMGYIQTVTHHSALKKKVIHSATVYSNIDEL